MHTYRFLGVLLALIVLFSIALFTRIDMAALAGLFAFVLSVDNLIVKLLTRMYMNAVLDEMENNKKDEQ